ncbi:MAG: hypothetical protein ACT443_16145 [Gemmatimonadota bacterium]
MLALLGACDLPTELPKWDTTFVVEGEATTLSVGQILPSSMMPADDNSAFALSLTPTTFSERLAALCAPCVSLNNTTAPKPPFSGTFGASIPLPADVRSAVLTAGAVNITLQNGFSFDPLRPGAATRGDMTIAIRSGGTLVGSTAVSGTTTAFPSGAALQLTVPLTAGTISNALDVSVLVNSPPGDPVQITVNQRLFVTATPTGLRIASARVVVTNRQVTATPVQFDFSEVDEFIIDHVKSGSLLLAIDNPFDVTGNLTLTLTGGDREITKTVAVSGGQTDVEVVFAASELQAILGHIVVMSLAGPVSAPGEVNVAPAQVVRVASRLKLIIGPED